MLRGNDFHQNYGLRDYKYFTLNKRFLLNNENSVLCLILLHQAVMVMSLSLSPEAGERTTPTVLHFTLQDLCLMSVSKLPVLVKRKRRLFPDVFSVNHPGLMEETEPNTVGCFCVRTSFRWQRVTEFSVKTQRHLHLTFLKGNVHIMLAGLEVLPHM